MSENDSSKPNDDSEEKAFLPPLDFSSVIAPLYIQAVVKLGILADPIKNEADVNLPLARRMIDLLDLLADRTKGRLEPEEEKYLETILSQLKMQYLEKSEAVKI